MIPTLRKFIAPLLLLLIGVAFAPVAQAKDEWARLRSDNFTLVGNADRGQLRVIAARLEQFRASFAQVLPGLKSTRQVPTTILVFNSLKGYAPFRPSHSAGHFVPGPDANFIVMTTELGTAQDAYSVIFHEYTHLLLNHSKWHGLPTWLNEGLAEYYSTFSTSGSDRVVVGGAIPTHLYHLRQERLLPLSTLFAVDNDSPYYNEENKQSIFYAQAWLLVHYLMQANGGARQSQLLHYIDLLLAGKSGEPAFREAFGLNYGEMELLLAPYARKVAPDRMVAASRNQLEFNQRSTFEPLSEAEVLAYEGDVALHMHLPDARDYLDRALALDPGQPRALAALGSLFSEKGEYAQARPLLEKALAGGVDNPHINFRFADAWLHESEADPTCLLGIPPERMARMQASLKAAIAADPDYYDAYRLLAYLSLLNDQDVAENTVLLEQVLARAPERWELSFMLGQLYLRRRELAKARATLAGVVQKGETAELRDRAAQVLRLVADAEAELRRPVSHPAEEAIVPDPKGESDERGQPVRSVLALRPTGPGEVRIRGSLTQIECAGGKAVVLVVKAGTRTYRLTGENLNAIRFATFTNDQASGVSISCGALNTPNTVLATYRPGIPSRRSDGDAVAIEFIPAETVLP